MNYHLAKLVATAGTPAQLPPPGRPEIAFVGRSNVGKSSLLNKLFGRRGLVKVSSKPGKTSTINFFSVGDVDFVDLPGYGFARASAGEQARWGRLADAYFAPGRAIRLVVALVDVRHDASPLDAQMLGFLGELGLPFAIALTKSDKLSRSAGLRQADALRGQLEVGPDVPCILCSATAGTGIDELRRVIDAALRP